MSMISVLGRRTDTTVRDLLLSLDRADVCADACVHTDQPGAQSSIWTLSDGSRTIAAFHTGDEVFESQLSQQPRAALFDNNKPQLNRSVRDQLGSHVLKLLDVDSPVAHMEELRGYDQVWFSEETWQQMGMDLRSAAAVLNCVVGVTAGPRAVTWIEHGQVHQQLPPSVRVKDSTGAGDTWRAHLVKALCEGADLKRAVADACSSTAQLLCR